ncbi:MAG: DMT family transporter, partial [Eubacterium sp.]|nr:DMT family transporter [Eubacterium sp.]
SGKTLIAILYTGVLSSGVAYTLQIIGQKDVNPTVASLLMSLESVFSVLGGWLILGDLLTVRELAGCGIMFLATVLSQLPADKFKNTTKKGPG